MHVERLRGFATIFAASCNFLIWTYLNYKSSYNEEELLPAVSNKYKIKDLKTNQSTPHFPRFVIAANIKSGNGLF
jgi:hypothetical protein